MNKLLVCISFAFFSLAAASQKVYFIYLQSESEQPFFVKFKDKVHSSSASGYLILSKLHDSTYSFSVGFPKSKWPEQNFTLTVNKKDHGFLLKNFGEKGWGLFDLYNLSIVQSTSSYSKPVNPVLTEKKDISEFTELLSKAADDPALKEKPVLVKSEEKKTDTIVQEVANRIELSNALKDSNEVKTVSNRIEPVIIEKPIQGLIENNNNKADTNNSLDFEYKKSIVTKRSESSTTEGFGLIFLDEVEKGIKDTIRLLIPNPQSILSVEKEMPKEEKKFIDIITEIKPKPEEEKKIDVKQNVKDSIILITEKKSLQGCPNLAEDSDFFKLRKSMAAIEGDDEMINEAKKYYKLKCFTTKQIKNLSTLFLYDEGKYRFFDASYLYVSDRENFSLLQSELKDDYFINRFKAMIRN